MHDRLHKVVCPRERHFGSVVGASGTLIVLGGRDGSATPMALGNHKVFQEKCKKKCLLYLLYTIFKPVCASYFFFEGKNYNSENLNQTVFRE